MRKTKEMETAMNVDNTLREQLMRTMKGIGKKELTASLKKEDLDRNDIEGLALGIYWPVRDYSQCDTYGGFVEYIHVYFSRDDAWDVLDGKETFDEAVENSEVITSLNLQPAKSVRPVFQ